MTYPGFEFHTLSGFVPRISGVYDVFGTGRTAIKLAYGRYSYNAGTMTNANSMMAGFVNPMARTVKRYRWDGTLPYVPNPANLLSTQGGANRTLGSRVSSCPTPTSSWSASISSSCRVRRCASTTSGSSSATA